jgi:biopolymer transport protein TolR
MGASIGSRGGHSRRFRPMAEINVTPMVDVMLVLLVIFMVTAPLLTSGVQVDLPKSEANPIKGDDQPIAISVDAKGNVWIQEAQIAIDDLVPKLQAIIGQKPDTRIFIRADKGIDYGRVMEVMGMLGAAGFNKIALVTEMKGGVAEAPSVKKGAR